MRSYEWSCEMMALVLAEAKGKKSVKQNVRFDNFETPHPRADTY